MSFLPIVDGVLTFDMLNRCPFQNLMPARLQEHPYIPGTFSKPHTTWRSKSMSA
jgi:hypothetical protein